MLIQDKVAVVTGGARGMGKAWCEALLQKGAKLCFGDVLLDEGAKVAEEFIAKYGIGRVVFRKCDVTSDEDVENIFKLAMDTHGHIDIVANVAGIIQEKEWQKCMDVNVGGTIRITNAALKYMGLDRGGQGGVMIHMASISALRPERWAPVYAGSKAAVQNFARSWAHPDNFAKHGIRINTICPTSIDTPFLSQAMDSTKAYYTEEAKQHLSTCDLIRPEYVAEGLIELIEDDTKNGATLRISKPYGRDYSTFPDHPIQ